MKQKNVKDEMRGLIDLVRNYDKKPLNEESKGLWANIAAKKKRGESSAKKGDDDYPEKKQWDNLTEEDAVGNQNDMFWQNLETIHSIVGELLSMDKSEINNSIGDDHGWTMDHVARASDNIEQVSRFLDAYLDGAHDGATEGGYEDEFGSVENVSLNEAEYKGKKVELGKPSKGDVKKFKVYVKNAKGNVVKVNFGDPNMEIKRDDPARKKAFRARFNCADATDRTTPKYWSCKMWSSTSVSDILNKK